MRIVVFLATLALVAGACREGGEPLEFTSPVSPTGDATRATPVATAARTATSPPPATSTPTPVPPTPTPTLAPPTATPVLAGITCETASVLDIADGDTLTVSIGGASDVVRLIGVDAPESGAPLFEESRSALVSLAGGTVCLERDQTERDAFDRLLRYAWREDGTLINEALVARGMALVVPYPPDVKYLASRYQPAEAKARSESLGLWANAPTAAAGSDGQCDPSYPDFCIPPVSVSGDLDCPDIGRKRFTVLQPDPHGFDRDFDGIGCES